jgi:hypothetical protein
MVGPCKHGNETLSSIKGGEYKFMKKNSVP